jgi:2-dehydro-3-deoxyphosphooctonate aldolase (KDO 8-P synthase)
MNIVNITSDIQVGADNPLLLIAGPCQIESFEHSLMMAEELKKITSKYPCNLVFKSSYDKANRTSIEGKRGLGIDQGLEILAEIKKITGLPVITDVHEVLQVKKIKDIVDIIQIPAFLCRQTDLLIAAGETGKAINIKKGQFLHPADMEHCAKKVESTGNKNILLCERGSVHGYRDLIVDPRSFVIMKETGYPVVFDATHSVAIMGGEGGSSGGSREYIAPLTRAAVAIGVDSLFIECHDNPDTAPSDAKSMLDLKDLDKLLSDVFKIKSVLF